MVDSPLIRFLRVATLAALCTGCTAPGADNADAKARAEADREWAELDQELATAWQAALAHWPADVRATEESGQKTWLAARDECWKEDDPPGCIEASYQRRIATVRIRSGQLPAPRSTRYDCGEGMSFLVGFYNSNDPPAALISRGVDQVVALRAPAASGARYTAKGVELWEHHGEATVDWFGTTLRCTVPR
jgi:uncharacterized protein